MKLLTILTTILLSTIMTQAFACSCQDLTVEELDIFMSDSDSVVLAVPTTDSVLSGSSDWEGPEVKTGMKIVKNFKGKYSKFFNVYSQKNDGGNCGVEFKKFDGLYLIFSYKENGKYYTSGCDVDSVDYENEELAKVIEKLSKR